MERMTGDPIFFGDKFKLMRLTAVVERINLNMCTMAVTLLRWLVTLLISIPVISSQEPRATNKDALYLFRMIMVK